MMGVKSTSLAMLLYTVHAQISSNTEKHPVHKRSKQTVAIRLGIMVPPDFWQPWVLLPESPATPPGPQKLEHAKTGTDGT